MLLPFTSSVNLPREARLEISFATKKLEKDFATEKQRVRVFGAGDAAKLLRRLTQLHAAANLEPMRTLPGRCHELHGDREGQLAVDVTRSTRLIFRPTADPPPSKEDGGLDWATVTAITILEVTDYHGS